MAGIEGFLVPFLNLGLILYIAAGVFVGIYVGAIPGLSVTMAVSILISFTFSWDVLPALAVMIGVFVGGVYGGSRSAILLNIPGAPSAVATAFDGYPLAKRGEAGIAMGISTTESVIGALFGVAVMALASPIVSEVALKVSPRDYVLLAIMGLLLVGSLSQGSMLKALITASLGIVAGLIGMDPITGHPRLTFGVNGLLGGISFIVVMIGLFGLSEALMQIRHNVEPVKQNIDKVRPTWDVVIKNLPLTIRSSLIGVLIGALPGTGGDIAALMAYDHAKRSVKNPSRPFGQGAIEGVIAPESANNAAIGGAFIPMMTLGIPGDAVTAVLIGGMVVHGIRPGPLLMKQQPEFFWTIIGCLLLANVFLYIFGMRGIKIFSKMVEIPKVIIVPIIIVLSIIGSYSVNNSVMDVNWMIAFGILGYFFKTYDYPVAPMVLGLILSPIIDTNYRRAMALSHNNLGEFFAGMFTNPISIVLILFITVALVSQTKYWEKLRSKITMKSNES